MLDTSPVWDSSNYYRCIRDATGGPFRLHFFRCADHSSLAYIMLIGLTQYIDFGNVMLVYVANGLLAAAAAVGFYALLKLLLPDALSEYERGLLVGLSVLSPVFFAHLIHINLDFGLTYFFILFLSSLLHRRFLMAALTGTAMAFTKETGMAAYGAALCLHACIFYVPECKNAGWKKATLRVLPLLIPGVLIALYFFLLHWKGWNAFWYPTNAPQTFSFGFNFAERSIQVFLFDLFALNFQWLLTLTICCAVVLAGIRVLAKHRQPSPQVDVRKWLFICLLFLPILYIVTRFRLWNSPRYILIATPLLLLLFAAAVASLSSKAIVRSIPLTIISLLILLSNFRTIDPVSKTYYETFSFGTHRMLALMSLTFSDMYPWYGRDEMVYNLEFRHLLGLSSDIYTAVKPTQNTLFVIGRWGGPPFFPPAVDQRTYHAGTNYRYSFVPMALSEITNLTKRNIHTLTNEKVFYFIAYPNLFNKPRLDTLLSRFRLLDTKLFTQDGYELRLYSFSTES